MASIIRIKRSSVSGNPATLAAGELAYSALVDTGSNGGDRLYIGIGTETGGNAANHVVIGGKYFTDMLDHSPGTLTATSALITDSNSKLDNLKVDNLDLNGNTLSSTDTNGNILITPNGTGKTIISNLYTDSTTSFTEYVQDVVGDMVTSNTESGIDVTYNDTDGKLNFDVSDFTITLTGDVTGTGTVTNLGNVSFATTIEANSVALGTDTTGNYVATVASSGNTITVTGSGAETAGINIDLPASGVTAGSYGSTTAIPVLTIDTQGRVTAASTQSISTTLNIAGDTGTDGVALGSDTLTFTGSAPIVTAVTNNTVTISANDSTTTTKGIASFSSTNFSVVNGAVSIKAGGVSNTELANSSVTIGTTSVALGGTSTSLAGITQLTVDNLDFNGNEISSTNTNGDISLNPNGTGNIAVNSSRITGLADPVNAQDAATKAYVDAVKTGLDPKDSVRVATTANLTSTYSNGAAGLGATLTNAGTQAAITIDSIVLSVGDRVLVKDQTAGLQNGIYTVTDVGSASTNWVLTRAIDTDNDPSTELTPGAFTFVEEGTDNADNGFVCTTNGIITIGTTAISWVQFSGAGQVIAGAALSKTGNTLNVEVASSGGIEIVSDALQLKSSVAGNGLTYTNGVVAVVGTTSRISVSADAIDIDSAYVGQTSITTLGTIGTGTWQGTAITPTYGGTGVNNGTKTITLGGNFTHTGAHTLGLTTTGNTALTLPTTGTLATLAGSETFTNKTITGAVISGGSINDTPIGATTRNTGAFTTLAVNSSAAFTAGTASSSTTTGTVVVTGGVGVSGSIYTGVDIVGSGAATSNLDGFNIDGGTY